MNLRAIIATSRSATASMPRWVLPLYWLAAGCLLLFSGAIWLVSAFCMSMRPLYERRR